MFGRRLEPLAGRSPEGNAHDQFSRLASGDEIQDFPVVRKIRSSDLRDALAEGFGDFRTMPSHLVFLALIYLVIGIVLYPTTSGDNALPLLFPLMAGYALIGPFAAIGLYEVSRRRELGLPHSWNYAVSVLRSPAMPSILAVGFALMAILLLWLATAEALYQSEFGVWWAPQSYRHFFDQLMTTHAGHRLLVLGVGIGFVYAVIAFSIGAISFPLLLDRDVGAAIAILTSVKAVQKNPVVMAAWALIVVTALVAGVLTLFVGLDIAIPILGHATWHLYHRVIAPINYFAKVNDYRAHTSFGFGPTFQVFAFSSKLERDAYVDFHNDKNMSATAINQTQAFQMVKAEPDGKRVFQTADGKFVRL